MAADAGEQILANELIFSSHLWRHLHAEDKRALRLVSRSIKAVVDGAVQTLDAGRDLSEPNFRAALTLFPGLTTITATSRHLLVLSAAALVCLKALTVWYVKVRREERERSSHAHARPMRMRLNAWGWRRAPLLVVMDCGRRAHATLTSACAPIWHRRTAQTRRPGRPGKLLYTGACRS